MCQKALDCRDASVRLPRVKPEGTTVGKERMRKGEKEKGQWKKEIGEGKGKEKESEKEEEEKNVNSGKRKGS